MTTNNDQKFTIVSGFYSRYSYETYYKDKVSKAIQEQLEPLWKDEFDEIKYYRISIDNPDDGEMEYSSLWFFDINLTKGKYLPLYLSGINMNSELAFEMLIKMQRDEDKENSRTLEELLEYVPDGNEITKESLERILLLKSEVKKKIILHGTDVDDLYEHYK